MFKQTGKPGPPSRLRLKRLRRSMGSIASVASVGSVRVAIAGHLGGGLTISAGHGQRLAGELHADPTLRRTCIESVEGFLKGADGSNDLQARSNRLLINYFPFPN